MSNKNKSQSITESAGWGLRLAALALTIVSVVVIYGVRFSGNGDSVGAILWAAVPILLGLVASFVLGKIKKLGSQQRKWQIYTYVLVIAVVGILINTWFL